MSSKFQEITTVTLLNPHIGQLSLLDVIPTMIQVTHLLKLATNAITRFFSSYHIHSCFHAFNMLHGFLKFLMWASNGNFQQDRLGPEPKSDAALFEELLEEEQGSLDSSDVTLGGECGVWD